MIARIFIYLLLVIALPDLYVYRHWLRRRTDLTPWLRWLWWLPGTAMAVYTVALAVQPDFAPDNIVWINTYLFLLGLTVAPKFIFVCCSLCGRMLRRLFGWRRNWGDYAGLIAATGILYILLRGSMVDIDDLKIRHIDLTFASLPEAFDGYRLVQFSDAHVGSLPEHLLSRAVDSINAQKADAVVFTGDLVNKSAREADRYLPTLASIRAADGVYSVLGNHDYSMYIKASDAEKRANEQLLRQKEQQMGWHLLLNTHKVIRRDADSLVIAGEENNGGKRFPRRGNLRRTLQGIAPTAFVVMLQHDPSDWRKSILPRSHAQLTLSGHTHGGQVCIFGFRPTRLTASEDLGLYRENDRWLYVSAGLGGYVPFRYGVTPEIVVITLHKQQTEQK